MFTERRHHRLPQQIERLVAELNLAQGFADLLEQFGMIEHVASSTRSRPSRRRRGLER